MIFPRKERGLRKSKASFVLLLCLEMTVQVQHRNEREADNVFSLFFLYLVCIGSFT